MRSFIHIFGGLTMTSMLLGTADALISSTGDIYAGDYASNDVGYEYGYAVVGPYTTNEDIYGQTAAAAFSASERRAGATTAGSYSVQLPDGRIQTVNYHVDGGSGYVADITYSGGGQLPQNEFKKAIATPTTYQGNINREITFPKAVQPSVYKSAIAYQPAPYTLNTAETAARTGARAAPTAVPSYVRANNRVVHNSNNNIQQVRPAVKPVYKSRIVYLI